MKFGVCTTTNNIKKLSYLKDIGFDYIEGNFKKICKMNQDEFDSFVEATNKSNLLCLCANCLIPSAYKLTSDGFDINSALVYLKYGFERCEKLGIKKVVFGSGGARKIPKNVKIEIGYKRLKNFLIEAGNIAKTYNIVIVIEPLQKIECNVINTVNQSGKLAKETNLDNIKAHADLFHMTNVKDNIDNINQQNGNIFHSHISNPKTRMYPKHKKEFDYFTYLNTLKNNGCETCSIEGLAIFFRSAAKKSINLLKSLDK